MSPGSRALHTRRLVAKYTRWLHIYGSMASFAVVFFFAVTGLTLNHPQWFASAQRTTALKGTLDAAWVAPAADPTAKKFDIVEHLRLLREQQDKTGGFFSFIPWVFQPQTKRFPIRHVTGREYLRLLAVSRLFLDNIANIEVSVMVMGKELAELGLYAGANDINSIVIEENVLRSSGLKTLNGAQRFIREAGFTPKRRTMNYEFGRYPD